jgi:CDP-diacylglycerol--glycerol-3-phosphate 3-phosphatidyltransferase/cardiolipin synthase
MVLNVPNALTGFRILAIPLVAAAFYLPYEWGRPLAGCLFALAGISDLLDGYLARKLGQITQFGAFLDPVADKLIVAVALVILVQSDPRLVVAATAAIIIGREITVSALREWMAELGARAHVAVSFFGKWKTTLQVIGISLMLYQDDLLGIPIYALGQVFIVVAAALTLWSMFDYLQAAWPLLRGGSAKVE